MLALPQAPQPYHADDKDLSLQTLPCSARLEGLSLALGEATRLTVPAAAARAGAFAALTDVFLGHFRVDSGSGDDVRLGEVLSSACSPRLRRLCLRRVLGLATLVLRRAAAGTLEDLALEFLLDLTSLDVRAPGVRSLAVVGCHQLSARRRRLQFDGAAGVRRMDLQMWSHRVRCRRHLDVDDEDDCNNNSAAAAVWLLRNCTGVDRLRVKLLMPVWSHIMEAHSDDIQEGGILDMMAEVPRLPNIIDLTIQVDASEHAIGASLAKLIAKCTNMEHLSVVVCMSSWSRGKECLDLSCICHHESTGWDSQNLSLEHLRNIEIHDMGFFDSQIRLVRLLLASATALERMTVGFDTSHLEDGEEVDFDDIPCCRGRWVPSVWECSDLGPFVRPVEYEWTLDRERAQEATGGKAC